MTEVDNQATAPEAPVETTATDKVEGQPSETNQSVSEAPEATQPNEETAEVKAEDKAEEKLIAGKFKSVEDLEKSYQELESRFSRETSDKAELAKLLQDTFVQPQEPTQKVDEYMEEPDPVNQKIEKLERDGAVSKFVFAHPDADGGAVNEILSTDPMVNNINGYEAKLEYAYLKSKNMSSPKAIEEATKKATTQAQVKIAEKQTAQVESASKQVATQDERSELRARMTTGPLAGREAARREYIRKYMV